jgi:hypothetical protein
MHARTALLPIGASSHIIKPAILISSPCGSFVTIGDSNISLLSLTRICTKMYEYVMYERRTWKNLKSRMCCSATSIVLGCESCYRIGRTMRASNLILLQMTFTKWVLPMPTFPSMKMCRLWPLTTASVTSSKIVCCSILNAVQAASTHAVRLLVSEFHHVSSCSTSCPCVHGSGRL